MITIKKTCHICNQDHDLQVSKESYASYQRGTHVQYAFPYLSADERELLISGICGKCFDAMFADEVAE